VSWAARVAIAAPAILFTLAWIPIDDPAVRSEPLATIADAVTGWILIAAGLVARGRRPDSRTGPLLVLAGYLWYVGDLYFVLPAAGIVPLLSFAFRGFYDVILAFVLLSFPGGRLERGIHRAAIVAVATAYGARAIAFLVSAPAGRAYPDNGTPNPFLVIHDLSTAVALDAQLTLLKGILIAAVAVLAVARLREAPRATRRVLLPVVLGGLGWAAFTVLADADTWTRYAFHRMFLPWAGERWWPIPEYLLRGSLAPLGFLIGAVLLRTARSAVVDLVSGIDRQPVQSELERSLRRALGDPELTVRYPDGSGWLDDEGRPAELPAADSGRVVTPVLSGGRTLAAIVHDPGLLEDPGLVGAIVATVRLAIDNEQLTAALHTQLEETQASRRRIAEAADAERQRIERDLHDGAQQRLVSLAISLRLLGESLGADAGQEALAELNAASLELRGAIDDLRELARGVSPAILREAGLAAGIRSLAERAPGPVRLELELDGRLSRPIEAAAYFVVAEALTNVARHAEATNTVVRARVVDDRLVVEIEDDGRGGADLERGSGLRGLADRVAAAGGRFEMESPPGRGTRLTAELPCG
jgi:signal transduction histidine kinase